MILLWEDGRRDYIHCGSGTDVVWYEGMLEPGDEYSQLRAADADQSRDAGACISRYRRRSTPRVSLPSFTTR